MEQLQCKILLEQVSGLNGKYEKISQISGDNFNIFRILKRETDEVGVHSAFLAELLNPEGSHGFHKENGGTSTNFSTSSSHDNYKPVATTGINALFQQISIAFASRLKPAVSKEGYLSEKKLFKFIAQLSMLKYGNTALH